MLRNCTCSCSCVHGPPSAPQDDVKSVEATSILAMFFARLNKPRKKREGKLKKKTFDDVSRKAIVDLFKDV